MRYLGLGVRSVGPVGDFLECLYQTFMDQWFQLRLQPRPSDHLACVRSNSSADVPSSTGESCIFMIRIFVFREKSSKSKEGRTGPQKTNSWLLLERWHSDCWDYLNSSAYGMRSLNNPGRPYFEYLHFFVCTGRNLGMGLPYLRDSVSRFRNSIFQPMDCTKCDQPESNKRLRSYSSWWWFPNGDRKLTKEFCSQRVVDDMKPHAL